MVNFNRVLVPVDFSSESGLAVDWAVRLLKDKNESTIYLLHVCNAVTHPICAVGCLCAACLDDGHEKLKWEQEKIELERWQEKIPSPISSDFIIRTGCLATVVGQVCNEHAIDLVIMTKRTRCGLSRLLHPHACVRIVRSAPCPVLVLHLNQKVEALVKASA